MENKYLGIILIAACIIISIIVFTFSSALKSQTEASCSCTEMQFGGTCPHEKQVLWPTYLGIALASAIAALGIYLIFFEKSQKEIISVLNKQKQMKVEDEKLDILMKGLTVEEQKVIKAVKEQDGITQQTLKFRTGMHKSKLSIVLDGLEKKGLIARKDKGKTKQVFIRIAL